MKQTLQAMRQVLLIMLFALPLTCMGCLKPDRIDILIPTPYEQKGVRVEVSGLYKNATGQFIGIDGIAKNTTNQKLQLCMISLQLLDESGTKVSDAYATTNSLDPNAAWRFQAHFAAPFSFRFHEIKPGTITILPARE
ncbi:hypothetical protein B7486_06035 [cyanobacterium TDX16]|nr:hypothetical protein B7486_06035 [cyanobacterium TDX16]